MSPMSKSNPLLCKLTLISIHNRVQYIYRDISILLEVRLGMGLCRQSIGLWRGGLWGRAFDLDV